MSLFGETGNNFSSSHTSYSSIISSNSFDRWFLRPFLDIYQTDFIDKGLESGVL